MNTNMFTTKSGNQTPETEIWNEKIYDKLNDCPEVNISIVKENIEQIERYEEHASNYYDSFERIGYLFTKH